MTNRQAAGSSQRQIFRGRRGSISRSGRADRSVAHGQAADLGGGRDVAVHERRRYTQHVGHVVEALGGIVGGKQRADVHIQSQQVANRVAVLVAIQAMERGRAGIGMRGRGAVELRFEARGEGIERSAIRPRRARRRHHAGANLADHFFPGFGVDSAAWRRVKFLENQIAGLQPLAVAGDAVLTELTPVPAERAIPM